MAVEHDDHAQLASGRRVPGTRWWIEIGAALAVGAAYLFGPRSAPSPALVERAHRNAGVVLRLEQAWGLDIEAGVQSVVTAWNLAPVSNWLYGTLHFVVTAATLCYLYRCRPQRYSTLRAVFVVASLLAFIIYRLVPVTPPRLLPGASGGTVLVDTLAEYAAPWTFESGAMSQVANQFAALPSMHAGWALFCAIALGIGRSGATRRALLAYPALVTLVVMGSGNHFFLDAVAGFAVVGLAFLLVAVVRRAWSPPPSPAPAAPAEGGVSGAGSTADRSAAAPGARTRPDTPRSRPPHGARVR
jgi:hypothetical protein